MFFQDVSKVREVGDLAIAMYDGLWLEGLLAAYLCKDLARSVAQVWLET